MPQVPSPPSLTLVAVGSAPAQSGLDPETGVPYQLQVVLHVAEHRLLTPTFQDMVERELRDSLQAALGDLAASIVAFATTATSADVPRQEGCTTHWTGPSILTTARPTSSSWASSAAST